MRAEISIAANDHQEFLDDVTAFLDHESNIFAFVAGGE